MAARTRRGWRAPVAAASDLGDQAADGSTAGSPKQAHLILEARAEARLDILLATLVDDPQAQQALLGICERVTVPLVNRIAKMADAP